MPGPVVIKDMKAITLTLILLAVSSCLWSQSRVHGNISQLPGASVVITDTDGRILRGTLTDQEGDYEFLGLSPGRYGLLASLAGDTLLIKDFLLGQDEFLRLSSSSQALDDVVITDNPLRLDETMVSARFDSRTIRQIGTRDIGSFAALVPGVVITPGGALSFRGGRPSGNIWFVDGVRVRGLFGDAVPLAAVQNLEFITGGFPASMGDFTGGVGKITTKEFLHPVLMRPTEQDRARQVCREFGKQGFMVVHLRGYSWPARRKYRRFLRETTGHAHL